MKMETEQDKWWLKEEYHIEDIESDISRGNTDLMGRKTKDGWEYALVKWFYQVPTLSISFKNGKITYLEED